jgi:hypothetical protein
MAPARLYVPITHDEFTRLKELAWPDRRPPAQMAAYLLARAIATYEQQPGPTADKPFAHLCSAANTEDDHEAVRASA